MLADLVPQLASASFAPANTKLCPMCGQDKPASDFGASNRHKGGARIQRWCKACHRQYNRNWYKLRGKQLRKERCNG